MKVANTPAKRVISVAFPTCKQFLEAYFPRQDAVCVAMPRMVEDVFGPSQQIFSFFRNFAKKSVTLYSAADSYLWWNCYLIFCSRT